MIGLGSDKTQVTNDKYKLEESHNQVKDVLLPRQMQRAMASEAEADRDARAKVLRLNS